MDRGPQFPEPADRTTSLDAPTCKHCGTEISTNVAKKQIDGSKAVYLYPPKAEKSWFHTAIGDIILNNEGTIRDLENDPMWQHDAEPADGRSHEEDYQRHAMNVRMQNIANGVDPQQAMEAAMKDRNIAYYIERDGFGVV